MHHQALSRRKILEWINLFASPAAEDTASKQEKWHIGTHGRRQPEARPGVQTVSGEPLKPRERRCGVAAASAQAAAGRNAFFELGSNASLEFARSAPHLTGAVNQIVAAHRNRGVLALKRDTGMAGKREVQPVMQSHGMVYSPDFVISIRAGIKNFQAKVDFREGAEADGMVQGGNCGRPANRQLSWALTSSVLLGAAVQVGSSAFEALLPQRRQNRHRGS